MIHRKEQDPLLRSSFVTNIFSVAFNSSVDISTGFFYRIVLVVALGVTM